jgi:hypothetical protein
MTAQGREFRGFRRRQEIRGNTALPQSVSEPLTLITNWTDRKKQATGKG